MGNSGVWCPVRHVIEQYNSKIRREIERCLDHIKTDGSSFLIRLCMIGGKGDKTNPTIMIFSASREMSRKFEASVRRSGVLDRYPELRLSSSSIPLEPPPIPLKSERRARRSSSLTANRNGIQASDDGASESSKPRIGRKLEIVVSFEEGPRVQHATGGLIVRIGDDLYQITTFASTGATKDWNSPHNLDEYASDSQSESGDSGYVQDFTSEKSLLVKKRTRRLQRPYRHGQHLLGSTKPNTCDAVCSPSPAFDGGVETSLFWREQDISFTHPTPMKATHPSHKEDSYYTLVKLTELESNEASNVVIMGEGHVPRGIDVLDIAKVGTEPISISVVTIRGPVSGTVLPDVASLRLRGSSQFQKVHAIILSEPLGSGDCGSAVIDAVTGNCYGHIIMRVEGHVVSYMVPITDTMANIVLKYGKLPSLQLDRHGDNSPSRTVERWKCVNPRLNTNCRPLAPLGKCRSCSSGKLYSARSQAAAHLRRRHFSEDLKCEDEHNQRRDDARSSRPPAMELKKWTKEITVTPLYAQVMEAESDSDSDYEDDVYDTDEELENESPPTSPDSDVMDRQAALEKENEDLRWRNDQMKREVEVLEGDIDVLMEDRDELKKELEDLRRRLSERDAQLVEAQLDAMLHIGCVRQKEAAIIEEGEVWRCRQRPFRI